MTEKVADDYAMEGRARPCSACLCDVVRCLLVCDGAASICDAFQTVQEHFEIVRVKNTFAEDDPAMGFRQILINVLWKESSEDEGMICEIQLNLAEYAEVKHKIHALYSVVRIVERERVHDLLEKKARPF